MDPLDLDAAPAAAPTPPATPPAAAPAKKKDDAKLAALFEPFGTFGVAVRAAAEEAYRDFRRDLPKLKLSAADEDDVRWATFKLTAAGFRRFGATPEQLKVIARDVADAKSVLADVTAIKTLGAEQLVARAIHRVFARAQDVVFGFITVAAAAL